MKRLQIPQKNLCTESFTYTKKFCAHEIASVDLSKIYFLKNAKKTCKPNNCDLSCDWKRCFNVKSSTYYFYYYYYHFYSIYETGQKL